MSTVQAGGGWFDAFRWKPFPTLYSELKTPVTEDVLYVGWLVAFLVVFVPFVAFVIPTLSGWSSKFSVFVRVTLSLSLGLVIMVCNFGQEWEVGSVETVTPYRAGSGQEIHASVGVGLGLRSVNVTLKALREPEGDLRGETINYNERFSWEWGQGRAGFGPFAGEIQRSFRAAQFKGTPLPILWVAEYFTFDGEGIRFGRYYRTSGWYAHICIWTAFPLWILTVILFKLTIIYASQTLALTGAMLTIAALIWAGNRNFIELEVPFSPPQGVLRTHYGIHWYLALIVGCLCMVLGAILYLLDHRYHNELSEFFGNNPLMIVEQETTVETSDEHPSNDVEMENMGSTPSSKGKVVTILRGRGTTKKYNKTLSYSPAFANPGFVSTPRLGGEAASGYQGQAYGQTPSRYNYGQQDQQAQGYQQDYPAQGYSQGYQAQGYQDYPDQGYQHQDYPHPAPYQGDAVIDEEEPLYMNPLGPDETAVPPPRPPKAGHRY
nr:dual oxidase maturation factor 1-like [Procambarus clarkii]XP_045624738.1 dual oxidase maturation factor 1-like [Procambarus clarkii]